MRKLSEKAFRTIIANAVIIVTILAVYVIGFLSPATVPISGSGGAQGIYHGNRESSYVSLMFNVYSGTEHVLTIMDILAEYDVHATFFVGGCWADDNEDALRRMVKEGHEIASHGYFHRDHKKLSEKQNEEEMIATERVIEALSGVQITLFAPPSGSYGEASLKACQKLGYKMILWSKDTIDWRDKDSALVYKRATKDVKGGDLVLMHPTAHTVEALPQILTEYRKRGLTQVTVSQNLA